MAPQARTLDQLPPDIVARVACFLPNPAPLAAICSTLSAQLDQDALLLDWATVHLPAGTPSTHNRHPGYALLHWHRLRCMSTARLAELLLKWAARHAPDGTAGCEAAQQLLDAGDALGALKAMLPHHEHLLLPYAAQAGHLHLTELLAAPGMSNTLALPGSERYSSFTANDMLQAAAHAAALGGHVAGMQQLLGAMESTGSISEAKGLLQSAVMGGSKAGACVAALAQLGRHHIANVTDNDLLPVAADFGSAVAVAALLELSFVGDQQLAYYVALCSSHLHLLPLLRPAGMSDAAAALEVCTACATVSSGDAGVLALLPDAVRQRLACRSSDKGRRAMLSVLGNLLTRSALMPALHSVWASVAPKQRPALALLAWDAMGLPTCDPCKEAVQWAVQQALPCVSSHGDKEKWQLFMNEAVLNAQAHGQSALLLRVQQQTHVTASISYSPEWRPAQITGALFRAVRGRSASAWQAATEAMPQFFGFEEALLRAAIAAGAADSDLTSAHAVVQWLAPHVGLEGVLELLLLVMGDMQLASDSTLLEVLLDSCPVLWWRPAVGAESLATHGHLALTRGCIGAAEWLVCHESQRGDYLSDLGARNGGILEPERAASLAALLHRLSASLGSHGSGSTAAFDRSGGDSTVGPSSSSSSSSSSGGSDGQRQPPAGARQITPQFVHAVLISGRPDLAYALLEFMDSWGLSCTASSI